MRGRELVKPDVLDVRCETQNRWQQASATHARSASIQIATSHCPAWQHEGLRQPADRPARPCGRTRARRRPVRGGQGCRRARRRCRPFRSRSRLARSAGRDQAPRSHQPQAAGGPCGCRRPDQGVHRPPSRPLLDARGDSQRLAPDPDTRRHHRRLEVVRLPGRRSRSTSTTTSSTTSGSTAFPTSSCASASTCGRRPRPWRSSEAAGVSPPIPASTAAGDM